MPTPLLDGVCFSITEKIDPADKSMEKIAQENEACQRLVTMPGVGPVISTAITLS